MKNLKITRIDKNNQKKGIKHILPIVQSGLALGLSVYLMRTGVLDYNKLVDMDNIKNMVSSIPMINLPLIGKSPAEVSIALVEKMVDTIGIQGIMLASKSFNFARDISKPILENDKIKSNPMVCKIKEVIKGKQNKDKEDKSNIKSPFSHLIRGGLSIGARAYLIATNQIDYNSIYNLEKLPHKLHVISDFLKDVDLNKLKIGMLSLKTIKDFAIQKHINDTVEMPKVEFEGIIKKISSEKSIPNYSQLKNTEKTIMSYKNKEQSQERVADTKER